jgi:hydrocephalus-inducing protein
VPGDGRSPGQAEFNITNERGCLERSKEAKIDIEFVPAHQQQYDMVLVVDLEGVGQDMLAVPIKADCDVPPVEVTPSDFLEYGECFLRHEKTMYLEIVNKDPLLQAKYEIVPQDDPSKRIAVYTADKPSGIINKRSTQRINIALRTEILSAVRIPMYIKVEGHPIPFMVTILATSRGPEVTCDRTELEFAPVTALVDETRKVTIKNESQIPAEYTAFTK